MLTGSLETFTSSEVLRLVAGTRKTGALVVRGTGPLGADIEVDVRVRDGAIVAASGGSALASDTLTSLADLLRISDGDFSFDADAVDGVSGPTIDVDEAIAEAEAILAEWQILESYVPTLDAGVELNASIDSAVTLHPRQWTTLSAIGTGCTVRDLARLTGEGPLETCRSIRVLVDLAVVRVLVVDDAAASSEEVERDARALTAVADLPLGPDSADLVSPLDAEIPVVSERFRHFSPRAAVAMAAASPGGAHLARPGDETVSRNVLLKFLASARQSA